MLPVFFDCIRANLWIFVVLFASTTCVDGVESDINHGNLCRADDEACFFERYGNYELSRVEPIKVGHVRQLSLVEGIKHNMTTAAINPPIFEIPSFLSPEECDHIITLSQKEGLEMSTTIWETDDDNRAELEALGKNTQQVFMMWDLSKDGRIDIEEMMKGLEVNLDFTPDKEQLLKMYHDLHLDKNGDEQIDFTEFKERNCTGMAYYIKEVKKEFPHTKSRHSQQAWLQSSAEGDEVMANIEKRVSSLTNLPLELIKASEYLQVVTYGPGGHYNCHLDSDFVSRLDCCHYVGSNAENCRLCRYLTVLYFLNDVPSGGETAFPIADNSTFDEKVWMRDSENVCNLAQNCHKSKVIVKPEKGKAVMWYSHHVDNSTKWMGRVDHYSFHGGCDVQEGRKWIANHWISVGNDRTRDIHNWMALTSTADVTTDTSSSKTESELRSHNEL